MTGLENLIKIGQATEADRRAGQLGLFGGTPETSETDFRLPEATEWTQKEKLSREKDVLGFFLSGHPLQSSKKTLDRYSTHQLDEIGRLEDKQNVIVGGAVNSLRVTITRKGRSAGQKMAMFRIMGLEACSVQAVCFAESFKSVADRIAEDSICLFTAVVDASREEASLRVQKIEPVEDLLADRVTAVILTLVRPDAQLLERLKASVRDLSGSTPLYLSFPGTDDDAELIRCGAQFKIKVDEESLDRLGALVGQKNVHCR